MTPKINAKPSASSPYEEPTIRPSSVIWMKGIMSEPIRSAGRATRAKIGALDDFVLRQFTGISGERHATLFHEIEMVRDLERQMGVLLDQENRHTLAVQFFDDAEDFLDDDRSQAERRLIHQQKPRTRHQRARHRQHLLLSAGQSSCKLLAALIQTRKARIHPLDVGGDPAGIVALVSARKQVLAHTHLREHQPVLRDKCDAVANDAGWREADKFVALKFDRTLARLKDSGGRHHQRRLACTVR